MPRFRISNPATGAGHPRITPGSFSQVTEDRLRSAPVLDVATANAKFNFGLAAAPPPPQGFGPVTPAMTSLNTPTGYELNAFRSYYGNDSEGYGLLNAFDKVIPLVYSASSGHFVLQNNSWVGVKLPVAKKANMLRVTHLRDEYSMTTFSIQGGDGWAGTWVTLASFNMPRLTNWNIYGGFRRELAFDSVVPYTHYRVLIDTIDGAYVSIQELEFSYDQPYVLAHAPMTGPTSPSPLVATALNNYSVGYPAWHMFDNSLDTIYFPSSTLPFVATIDTGVSTPVDAIDFILNDGSQPARDYTIDGSNDGTTWTNIASETNKTNWNPGPQPKVRYELGARVTFRHYRWRCTAGTVPTAVGMKLLVKA